MKEAVELCNRKNIIVGTFLEYLEEAHKWANAGVKYISFSVDVQNIL